MEKISTLIDRIPQPLTNLKLDLELSGVFAFPEEWKQLDDANPGVFAYQLRYGNFEFSSGKIFPRELSDKEKRELEEQ